MPLCGRRARPRKVDGAWSWVVVLAAFLSTLLLVGFTNCFAVVMPVLLNHFHETRQIIAWVGSIALGLTFFASPLAGIFIEKFNFRITAVIGACACTVGLVLTSYTQSTLQLFFSYSLLYGIGSCFVFMSCVYAVNVYFDRWQSLALGLISSGSNVGVLSLGPLLQVLLSEFGWRVMYRIMAGLAALVLLLVMTFDTNVVENSGDSSTVIRGRTETVANEQIHSVGSACCNNTFVGDIELQAKQASNGRRIKGEESSPGMEKDRNAGCEEGEPSIQGEQCKQAAQLASEDEVSSSKLSMFKETITTPVYIIALTTITLEALMAFVSFVHLVKYCEEVGISAKDGSKLFIFLGVASLVAAPLTGRVLDIPAVNPFHVNQIAAVTMGISMLLLQLATEYKYFIVFATFLGLGLGGFCTTILVLYLKTVPERLVMFSYPVGQMFSSLGNISGPPLIGFIADAYGSYRPAYYTAGGIMIFAAFVPFLQYCFKPWRVNPSTMSSDNQDPAENGPRVDQAQISNSENLTSVALEGEGHNGCANTAFENEIETGHSHDTKL